MRPCPLAQLKRCIGENGARKKIWPIHLAIRVSRGMNRSRGSYEVALGKLRNLVDTPDPERSR